MADKKPPQSAEDLLQRYAGGEREFEGAKLKGANLKGAKLGGADLSGADLSGADLSGADLSGADLLEAKLVGARLKQANLYGANLKGANLLETDLVGVDLLEAYLEGANLKGAKLDGIRLRRAILKGTTFEGARLRRADLVGADLEGATLEGADLGEANLEATNLFRATFDGANLERAILKRATLVGATLEGADLVGADLGEANLVEARFDEAKLEGADLKGAYYGAQTRFPHGFDSSDRHMNFVGKVTDSNTNSEERKYRPYPVELVEELEKLTRERANPSEGDNPKAKQDRQARIDDICMELKSIPSPRANDIVVGSRLVRIIGKGNFGTVWQATDEEAGEQRAVKIFDSDRLGLSQALYHFRRGVRAMEHLNKIDGKPSTIVKLYNVDEAKLAFSMKYIDNGDLTEHTNAGWDIEKKVLLFRTLCETINFAHRNKVIHRDIKPANIVIARSGEPILTDFDISDLLFVQTQSAQAAGTIRYAAPEQLGGKPRRDATGDIYSLGRILHFLLVERDPDIVFEEVQKLEDLKDQPEALVCIIRKCTLRNPDGRYPTVDELLSDLGKYRIDPDVVDIGTPESDASLSPKETRGSKKKPISGPMKVAIVTGFFMLVAAAIGIIPWLIDKQSSKSEDQPPKQNPYQSKQSEIARLRGITKGKEDCEKPPCDPKAKNQERITAAKKLLDLYRNSSANLQGVNLVDAVLFQISLPGVNLEGSDLRRIVLFQANLVKAKLKGAKLMYAKLISAKLIEADLTDANLFNADLSIADCRRAILLYSNLENTILKDTKLMNADLRNARLNGADLEDANLEYADLRSADLMRAYNVEKANFKRAMYNYKTKFPKGFDPKSHGMIEKE